MLRRALLVSILTLASPLSLVFCASDAVAAGLPPQDLRYRIEVWIEPATRGIRGRVEIDWTNPSATTIRRVPLHLYLNAFAHEHSTWMRTAPKSRVDTEAWQAKYDTPWGHSEPRSIVQIGADGQRKTAPWWPIQPNDNNPLDRSLIEIDLPDPLAPGQALKLQIDFIGRLPVTLARTGGDRDYFFVAQWFPKLGAFERAGVRHAEHARWAARQFHGPTEFYANFADYDVTINLPAGWLVGATGERIEPSSQPSQPSQRSQPSRRRPKDGSTRARYRQRAVHDFAFVAGKHLAEVWALYRPKHGGPEVKLRYLVPKGAEHQVPRWRKAVEGALAVFSRRIGPYPYRTLTIVMPSWRHRRSAGMEYPTLFTGVPGDALFDSVLLRNTRQPDGVLIHEFGHQYFYGLLASNEQVDAFLDEGFNTYWQVEVMRELYGKDTSAGTVFGRAVRAGDFFAHQLQRGADVVREPMRQRPAALFYPGSWGSQIYSRSVFVLGTAASLFGQRTIDRVFAAYLRRFAFAHPDVEDFLAVARDAGSAPLADFLRESFSRPRLPDYRVVEAKTQRFRPPHGRVKVGKKTLMVTADNREAHAATLAPQAAERDGRVSIEVLDPGWTREGHAAEGRIYRERIKPHKGAAPGKQKDGRAHLFESTVRIIGPAWNHLPVTVELTFADGVVVRDAWDGKAAWRAYRFVRAAELQRVQIDPAGRIALDVQPENNARELTPDPRFAADWGSWLAALGLWVMEVAALWL